MTRSYCKMQHTAVGTMALLVLVAVVTASSEASTPKPSYIRTELRVAKSMRPEDTQEIKVRSNNGGFAKIVVKKRDSKTASLVPRTSAVYSVQPPIPGTYTATRLQPMGNAAQPKWAPFQQTSLMHSYDEPQASAYAPSSYRFDTPKSESDNKLIHSFMEHIGQLEQAAGARGASSSRDYIKFYEPTNSVRNTAGADNNKRNDLLTLSRSQQSFMVPKPVFITSQPVEFSTTDDNGKTKRGRSLMKIGGDGIPIVEGIRMPDDEQDKVKTWRQGRVINGELFPYEAGYVPKKAVPLTGDYGQLLFVKSSSESDKNRGRSIGPFTKSDNFKMPRSTGPFTVDDNRSAVYARSDNTPVDVKRLATGSIGPFTVKDNSRMVNSKLIDYIKTINDEETRRRDLFEARHTFKRDAMFAEPEQKMQRRMLENAGDMTFASSKYYAKDSVPVKSSESSRSPVLEYAHPEFGAQAASAHYPATTGKPKVQYYASSAPNTPITLQKHEYFPQAPDRYTSSEYVQAYPSQFTYDSPSYGYKNVKEQPFYMRLAEQMREGVQNGFASMLKPIVEVGQKITKNLGFGRSMSDNNNDATNKDLFVFMQNIADGRTSEHLHSDISVGEDKVRVKRNDADLYGIGGSQLYKNDKHDDEHETQFIEEVDITSNRGHLKGYGVKKTNAGMNFEVNHQMERKRRSLITNEDSDYDALGDALLQNVASDSVEPAQRFGDNIRALIQNTDWTNTQCAKRVFCEVMLQQTTDDVALMEKKLRKFLPMWVDFIVQCIILRVYFLLNFSFSFRLQHERQESQQQQQQQQKCEYSTAFVGCNSSDSPKRLFAICLL